MRVGVDGRSLGAAETGLRQARGVTRAAGSLLDALRQGFPGDEWLVRGRGSRIAAASAALLGRPRLDRAFAKAVDVVWLPAPAPVAVSRGTPYVLTVYDLSFEERPADLSRYERLWARASRPHRLAERAALVACVSEATRAAVLERWALDPERTRVVRCGVRVPRPGDASGVRRRLGIPERFLLFVGALEPRKAPDVLVRAFSAARSRGLEAGLVLVGDGRLRDRLAAPGVVVAGRLSDEELDALYANALATVLPSRLEGFGFTPLESLAAGTPAVASDLPALRETTRGGALLVPPGDEAALADALLAVDGDERLRRRLVEAGREAVGALRWDRAAAELRALLAEAAGS
jgi:glycosyltransferase involved in cell wall biosynthesis